MTAGPASRGIIALKLAAEFSWFNIFDERSLNVRLLSQITYDQGDAEFLAPAKAGTLNKSALP